MVDRDRVLAKLDELDGYLREIASVAPDSLAEFGCISTKRACERLLQISVECVIDVCGLLVRGERMGLPADTADLFEKLERSGVLTAEMKETLRRMKGFRNVLVHDYARVDDALTFEMLRSRLGDFTEFKRQVLRALAAPAID